METLSYENLSRTRMPPPDLSSWGRGRLEFEKVGGRTVLSGIYCKSPLKFLAPRNAGDAAWVYSSSFGGGLLGGDAIEIEASLGEGARAALLSQSSNKVYRSEFEARQRLKARLGPDASLFVIPDPTVCFEGSRFSQRQRFELDESASLLLLDTFHCGRGASGERWVFEHLKSRIEIFRAGQRIFLESMLLDARAGVVPKRVGRFNAIALAVLTGPEWAGESKGIAERIAVEPLGVHADLLVSASPLGEDGVVVRIAGVSTEEVGRRLREYLRFVPERLGDNPWGRKW